MSEASTGMKAGLYEPQVNNQSGNPMNAAAYPPAQVVQPVYNQNVQAQPYPQQQQYPQQQYPQQQQGQQAVYTVHGVQNDAMTLTAPPTQRWRDGICDWGTNLWPSCGCVCCFYGLGSAWLVSQISQKTAYMNFYSIMRPFLFMYIFAWLIDLIFGFGLLYIIPGFFIYFLGIMLRFHLMRTYQISENGEAVECLIGCFCWPCSVAQMARHVYGYTKVFDGDADPERADNYVAIVEEPRGQPAGASPHASPYATQPNVVYVQHPGNV